MHFFKQFIIVACVVTLVSCGGGGGGGTSGGTTPSPGSGATPSATAVGVANGSMVSATIGAAGGSLSAADGKLALTIPAGALATNTVIGIQPLTNMAHGKIGAAYRLTPDGQTFLKPVTLTFTYTDQDLLGTAVEVLGAAFQTADGYWQWAGDATVDTAAKTVSVASNHFTDVSLVEGLQIFPAKKVVKTNGNVGLQVKVCYEDCLSTLGTGATSLGLDCSTRQGIVGTLTIDEWSVNGTQNYRGVFGTLTGVGATATYTAPANEPIPNTFAVSARVHNPKKGPNAKTLVLSSITISEDSWTGTASSTTPFNSVTANVIWTLESTVDKVSTFRPSGIATVSGALYNSGCIYSPLTGTINPGSGAVLIVDYNVDPPTYRGGGATSWPATLTCPPNPQVVHITQTALYFGGGKGPLGTEARGLVSGEGTIIEGTDTMGDVIFNWKFTRD
jgi:hypothetical protein